MCAWRFDGGTRWSVAPPSRQAEAIEYTLSRSNRMLVEAHTSVFFIFWYENQVNEATWYYYECL